MTKFERYMILTTMAFFFSFMVIGLVSVNTTLTEKNTALIKLTAQNISMRLAEQQNVKSASNEVCYDEEAIQAFISLQKQNYNKMHFLTAQTMDGKNLDVYINGAGDGRGEFVIISQGDAKGCIIAQGAGMRVAVTPTAGTEGAPAPVEPAPEESAE